MENGIVADQNMQRISHQQALAEIEQALIYSSAISNSMEFMWNDTHFFSNCILKIYECILDELQKIIIVLQTDLIDEPNTHDLRTSCFKLLSLIDGTLSDSDLDAPASMGKLTEESVPPYLNFISYYKPVNYVNGRRPILKTNICLNQLFWAKTITAMLPILAVTNAAIIVHSVNGPWNTKPV